MFTETDDNPEWCSPLQTRDGVASRAYAGSLESGKTGFRLSRGDER